MHGYQNIQQFEERSGGAWKPSPGSVYPTLQLLTDEGRALLDEMLSSAGAGAALRAAARLGATRP